MVNSKLIQNHHRDVRIRLLFVALIASLVSTCSDHAPSKSVEPEPILVFRTGDGIHGDFGKIAGNLPSEFYPLIGPGGQLVQAANNCAASYSVYREYSHITVVSVDTRKLGLDRNEIVECVKDRFAGQFDAGIGDPEALETFDDTLFTQFHDRGR